MEVEKEYIIAGSSRKLEEILINLEYYGKLHPLIKSVKKKESMPSEYEEYTIKERPYNWIPIIIEYSAQVKSFKNKIEYEIIGIPFTKTNIRYELNKFSEERTKLTFRLTLKSKIVGLKILRNKMLDAQDKLINAINAELKEQEQ